MEREEMRVAVLGFIEKFKKTPKGKRILRSIPRYKGEELINKLIKALEQLPEAKVRAAATESQLNYVSWAINQRSSYEVVHSYDKYRAEINKLLTNTSIAFSRSRS